MLRLLSATATPGRFTLATRLVRTRLDRPAISSWTPYHHHSRFLSGSDRPVDVTTAELTSLTGQLTYYPAHSNKPRSNTRVSRLATSTRAPPPGRSSSQVRLPCGVRYPDPYVEIEAPISPIAQAARDREVMGLHICCRKMWSKSRFSELKSQWWYYRHHRVRRPVRVRYGPWLFATRVIQTGTFKTGNPQTWPRIQVVRQWSPEEDTVESAAKAQVTYEMAVKHGDEAAGVANAPTATGDSAAAAVEPTSAAKNAMDATAVPGDAVTSDQTADGVTNPTIIDGMEDADRDAGLQVLFDSSSLPEHRYLYDVRIAPSGKSIAVLIDDPQLCSPGQNNVKTHFFNISDTGDMVMQATLICDPNFVWSSDGQMVHFLMTTGRERPGVKTMSFKAMKDVPGNKPINSLDEEYPMLDVVNLPPSFGPQSDLRLSATTDLNYIVCAATDYRQMSIVVTHITDATGHAVAPNLIERSRRLCLPHSRFGPLVDHHRGHFYVASEDPVDDRPKISVYQPKGGSFAKLFQFTEFSPGTTLTALHVQQDYLIVYGTQGGAGFVRVFDLPGHAADYHSSLPNRLPQAARDLPAGGTDVTLPETFVTVRPTLTPQINSHALQFYYESPTTDTHLVQYDLKTKAVQFTEGPRIKGFGVGEVKYEMVNVPTTANPEIKIPMLLVRKPSVSKGGDEAAQGGTPLPQEVYIRSHGAYGELNHPRFRPENIDLLKRGTTLAYPYLRGGGDMGTQWYEAATGLRKVEAVNDLIRVSEWLIETGRADKDHLALECTGGGGFVGAAAMNMKPGLFRAVFLDSPVIDPLFLVNRLPAYLVGRETREWGDLNNDAEAARAMLKLSPYHNLNYPSPKQLNRLKARITAELYGEPMPAPLPNSAGSSEEDVDHITLQDFMNIQYHWPSLYLTARVGRKPYQDAATINQAQVTKWVTELRATIYRITDPFDLTQETQHLVPNAQGKFVLSSAPAAHCRTMHFHPSGATVKEEAYSDLYPFPRGSAASAVAFLKFSLRVDDESTPTVAQLSRIDETTAKMGSQDETESDVPQRWLGKIKRSPKKQPGKTPLTPPKASKPTHAMRQK
ncbi:hypothetical protein IWQ60_001547 [Tieghemiomyces parasiticus]|uniref:Prolyl endopeptidase-like n=1 Tax=Tieghemiomyces parasiticus TaxID=78921 RepID=A0A9W8DY76_9FUNG|nr:hypothetical protein IWQ60_001547 [Tieghemiomyces parasiticus]